MSSCQCLNAVGRAIIALGSKLRALIYYLFAVFHTAKIYRWLANNHLERLLAPIKNPRVMEVGPGTGEGTRYLAPLFTKLGATYHAIELDPSYATRLVRQSWFDAKSMHATVTNFLTLPAETFKNVDVLLMIECLMLMDEVAVTKQLAAARAMNPKLIIVMAHVEFETDTQWDRLRTAVARKIKPLFFWFTTIHFGRPLVRNEFLTQVRAFSNSHAFITTMKTGPDKPGITIDHNIFGCPLRVYALA